ncbi:CBS domain-containing protein [Alteribacillus sp. JSM 102045]|uniref:CBS domain-containing protein n=1 Tax=Alteribacillus sp. JSM 102045 TaxID=1562101 RepID=UPI0035C0A416
MQTIKEHMTNFAEYCNPSDDLYTLAKKMKENEIGFLPIVNDDHLVGCITDRDIVIDGLAKEVQPNKLKAENIMQEKVITGYPDMSVDEASRLMQDHQIQRLVITEDQKVKGVVSIGDLAVSKGADQAAGNALSEISKPHPS